MQMISAKELRQELKFVLEQVDAGEEYTIIYRSKPIARIVTIANLDHEPKKRPNRYASALKQLKGLGTAKDVTTADKDKLVLSKRKGKKYGV